MSSQRVEEGNPLKRQTSVMGNRDMKSKAAPQLSRRTPLSGGSTNLIPISCHMKVSQWRGIFNTGRSALRPYENSHGYHLKPSKISSAVSCGVTCNNDPTKIVDGNSKPSPPAPLPQSEGSICRT
jgi:hypothetical protein